MDMIQTRDKINSILNEGFGIGESAEQKVRKIMVGLEALLQGVANKDQIMARLNRTLTSDYVVNPMKGSSDAEFRRKANRLNARAEQRLDSRAKSLLRQLSSYVKLRKANKSHEEAVQALVNAGGSGGEVAKAIFA